MNRLNDALNQLEDIDFTLTDTDAFHSKEACDQLEHYIERWQYNINAIRGAEYKDPHPHLTSIKKAV